MVLSVPGGMYCLSVYGKHIGFGMHVCVHWVACTLCVRGDCNCVVPYVHTTVLQFCRCRSIFKWYEGVVMTCLLV